ncbi:MAG: hypothetical protein JWQ38_1244 [Flavipsychrobacter sp.]|nr:hypothetical protein [Flavipsychrobacter sp.]
MFNNVALDVAIGLVFIFLVYSLLATTIQEMIARSFSLRGRMLVKGIRAMLEDRHEHYEGGFVLHKNSSTSHHQPKKQDK